VKVQCNIAVTRSCKRVDFHVTLLLVFGDRGADFWV
jgi:hypothetical protein